VKNIDKQTLQLIEMIIKIPVATDSFEKENNPENLQQLFEIVKQSEKEFDILKTMLANAVQETEDDFEVEAIETENGYEVK
jgi:hypothetical protein